jgi:lysine 6-dehydrogenase
MEIKMKKKYVILGSGMQGTAAAYDLAKFADAESVTMADMDIQQAQKAVDRVNNLLGSKVCKATTANAKDTASLTSLLQDADVLLSCVPYYMHPEIAKVAIATKTHMLDLGGNTDTTRITLDMTAAAEAAGVTLVPDCGLAPGLVNSLGMWLIENVDNCQSVKLYCGVLPQNPVPPLNYKVTFNVEGLVTEYDYEAVVLREGQITMVPTLTELEHLQVDGLGEMEAFVTSGGTSMAPYSLQGKVANYEYKTFRFPGHCAAMKMFKDFGFWREDAVNVKGVSVVPKDVFCKVFGESLSKFVDKDMCIIRAVGVGNETKQIDIHDRQCEETGFTSMERLTGYSLSIYAIDLAAGKMPTGALRYELAMTGTRFVEEIQKRGVSLKFS